MDGPDIHKLFTETNCLTAKSNLKEICQYLRFFKNEDCYQTYLKKYLPLLAHPEFKEAFDEFVGDLEDKEIAKELKKGFRAPEPTPEALEAIKKLEEERVEREKLAAEEEKAAKKAEKESLKAAKKK